MTGTHSVQFPWPALAALTLPCSQTYSRSNIPNSPNPIQRYEKSCKPPFQEAPCHSSPDTLLVPLQDAIDITTSYSVSIIRSIHCHKTAVEILTSSSILLFDKSPTPRCTAVGSTALPPNTTTQNSPQSRSPCRTSRTTCRSARHRFCCFGTLARPIFNFGPLVPLAGCLLPGDFWFPPIF